MQKISANLRGLLIVVNCHQIPKKGLWWRLLKCIWWRMLAICCLLSTLLRRFWMTAASGGALGIRSDKSATCSVHFDALRTVSGITIFRCWSCMYRRFIIDRWLALDYCCTNKALFWCISTGVISRGTRGNAIRIVKVLRTHYGPHFEPFSDQKCTRLQDFAYTIWRFFRGWCPRAPAAGGGDPHPLPSQHGKGLARCGCLDPDTNFRLTPIVPVLRNDDCISAFGDRAFSVAASRPWNTLPAAAEQHHVCEVFLNSYK